MSEKNNQHAWAGLAIVWVFVPFIYSLSFVLLDRKKTFSTRLANSAVHLPFVIPAKNIYHAIKLARINYDQPMSVEALSEREKLQYRAGQLTFREACLVRFLHINNPTSSFEVSYTILQESGPQLVTQLSIILCTNHPSHIQIISMVISYFSLSLAACRAFYIPRDNVHADPGMRLIWSTFMISFFA